MKTLLDVGAVIDKADNDGKASLHAAARSHTPDGFIDGSAKVEEVAMLGKKNRLFKHLQGSRRGHISIVLLREPSDSIHHRECQECELDRRPRLLERLTHALGRFSISSKPTVSWAFKEKVSTLFPFAHSRSSRSGRPPRGYDALCAFLR